jgi:hypothetical protein
MKRIPVIVERVLPRPTTLVEIEALDRDSQWCISAHGAAAVLHAIQADGLRSICVYRAPDIEAMRRISDTLKLRAHTTLWSAVEHWSPAYSDRPELVSMNDERVIGLVERRFDKPMAFSEAEAIEAAQSHCLQIGRVRFLRSYLARDGRRMLCLYSAPDLEAIRTATRLIDLPVEGTLAVMVRVPD